jgi:hypothetical protein
MKSLKFLKRRLLILLNNYKYNGEIMADHTRDELQDLLNSTASRDNKIDVAFVFESKTGTIMHRSTEEGYSGFGGKETVKAFQGWLGRLKDTPKSVSAINLGDAKYLIIPFDHGLLNLYFEEKIFAHPVIIGFVYKGNDAEGSMGEMLYNTNIAVNKITDLLKLLLPLA